MSSQSWTVPGLEVAHSKTEGSWQSSLGCISQSEVLCGLQQCPQCTQGSGLDPCCWQVLNSLLPQLNIHTKFDFMLCLSEDFHTLYHAEGEGLKFCTLPNVGSLQHTICVRVLWSLAGCITLCRGTSLLAGHRTFVGHLWHFCPCSWQESHRVCYMYQY